MISFSSPTDLTTFTMRVPRLVKQSPSSWVALPRPILADYAAASPVDQVAPTDPPVFLVHGMNDPLVPVSQSEELATALTSAGVPNQLVLIPGAGHNLDFPTKTPRNLVLQILEFLNATWKDSRSQSLIP